MMWSLRGLVATGTLLLALITGNAALAQKHGGVLKLSDPGSPANMSVLELPTIQGEMPMMGVFNNLIVFAGRRGSRIGFLAPVRIGQCPSAGWVILDLEDGVVYIENISPRLLRWPGAKPSFGRLLHVWRPV